MPSNNIFQALEQDHETQRTLVDLVLKTKGDSDGRRELFGRLVRELRSHAKAEERTLYAVMLGEKETQDETAHSVHEHELMEKMMDELLETDMSSSAWIGKFKELADRVVHHLDEEEEDTFAAGRDLLSGDRAQELGDEFRREKETELEERPAEISAQR